LMFFTIMCSLIMLQAEPNSIIAPDARLEKLAGGMKFTEGPVWTDADGGYLVFSSLEGISLKTRYPPSASVQTGPSVNFIPPASFSSLASGAMIEFGSACNMIREHMIVKNMS